MTAVGGTVPAAGVLLAGGDSGRASPIGLFVILALCVAVYFLWKSLNRHLKRVPDSFADTAGKSDTATSDTATSGAVKQDTGRQDTSAGPDVPGPAGTNNGEN